MDKLAPAIAWVKENIFWLANGLLLLLMIGIWYSTTASLDEATADNENKINREFQTVQNIRRQKPEDLTDDSVLLHPNRSSKEGMQAELKRTVDSIVAAWKLRVDAQKKLLVFPEVIGNNEFSEIFAQYNPPETFPTQFANDKKIAGLLSLYKLKIREHMANITGDKGVRTNWKPEEFESDRNTGSRGGGGDEYGTGGDSQRFQSAEDDASRFAVIWSKTNQKLWYDKLTKFQDRDDHDKESNEPTPLQAYMLQQDLWVLEAMFKVIRQLNGDSSATDTSAIKQIDHIGIGREGNVKLGKLRGVDRRFGPNVVDDPEASSGQSQDFESESGPSRVGSEYEVFFPEDGIVKVDDEFGRSSEDDFGGESLVRRPPFHEMYVDTKFEVISSEEVLKVVKGETLPETNLELLIAKRLPVRIALKMDERKIPDFMAASGNSDFSFEIQQVRINRHAPGGEVIALGGGKANGSAYDADSRKAAAKFDEVSQVETRVNYNVNVEFFGIVKIYNPVRADLIRKAAGLEPEDPASEGSADSAAIRNESSAVGNAG